MNFSWNTTQYLWMRISGVLLIFLSVYFVINISRHIYGGYVFTKSDMCYMSLFFCIALLHGVIGMQSVMLDYIKCKMLYIFLSTVFYVITLQVIVSSVIVTFIK